MDSFVEQSRPRWSDDGIYAFSSTESSAMRLIVLLLVSMTYIFTAASSVSGAEPITLMGIVSQWKYPNANISGSEMSDAATADALGKRTAQSLVCETTMTTDDSVDEVIAFYKAKLAIDKNADEEKKAELKDGRSVVMSNESEGRPFALHAILVNTPTTSTMLIISRGHDEPETHINWKHYVRL